MDVWRTFVVLFATVISLLHTAGALYCYSCVSTIAGCGKQLNIRLQRWEKCENPPSGGGENFCVKVIENKGGEEIITRQCLMTLRKHTLHRQKLPTVQRHGYCSHGRNNDPTNPYDLNSMYCFCNDWNGCNLASGLKARGILLVTFAALVSILLRWL